jgi:biotin carboxylase
MFASVLIANRGEIACRIARTAARLGLRTIAVFSQADANALHVRQCDEAFRSVPAPAAESYLVIDRLIDVARQSARNASTRLRISLRERRIRGGLRQGRHRVRRARHHRQSAPWG